MALLGNGVATWSIGTVTGPGVSPGRYFWATAYMNLQGLALGGPGALRNLNNGEGSWDGSNSVARLSARPIGYTHPAAWLLADAAGGMASTGYTRVHGDGDLDGNLAGGKNAEAALSGSGTISNAALGLIVSAVAALAGSGSLAAAIIGKLEAAASIGGSGSLAAALGALSNIAATVSGAGTLAAVLSALGSLVAEITVVGGELTAGQIADAVWDEVLAQHLTSGSTGAALNGAGSAGDPWGTTIPGAYGAGTAGKLVGDLVASGAIDGLDAVEAIRVLLAVMAGKTTITDLGGGNATVVFRDVADTKDRVEADMTGSERTNTTVDGS